MNSGSLINTVNTNTLINQYGENEDKVINCFFNNPIGGFGGRTNTSNSIVMQGLISGYIAAGNNVHWGWTPNFLHEIYHCFGLGHLYYGGGQGGNSCSSGLGLAFDGDGISDTKTREEVINSRASSGVASGLQDPCGWNNPPWTSNNLMTDNASRHALTPGQVAYSRWFTTKNRRSKLDDGTLPIEYHSPGDISNITNYCDFGGLIPPLVINSGDVKIWNDSKILKSNLIIEPGAKLTIKCSVHMPSNTRITVKKGGYLIIDGGVITNDCNKIWKGIEVFGDNNLNQYTSSNQGKVDIINGSRIENAINGVSLIGHNNDGSLAWGTAGGRLNASNSTFYNCRRGVEFMAYNNFTNSGNPARNRSRIQNCEFIFTDNFNELYTAAYYPVGISMWGVDGAKIKGCDFKNEISYTNSETHSKYDGYGIYSFDASPVVNPVYAGGTFPPSVSDRNTFSGFDVGVYSSNPNGAHSTLVRDNIFTDNKLGVYLDNSSNSTIVQNEFNVPNLPNGSSSYDVSTVGVFLKNSSDFEVEENEFMGSPEGDNFDGGLAIEEMLNSNGNATSNVYKNNFENLGFGFLAYGENGETSSSTGANTYSGLGLECNDFGQSHNNFQDWYIDQNASIRGVQGGPNTPTGNVFSPSPGGTLYGHIFMGVGSDNIDNYYRHDANAANPHLSNPSKVNIVNTEEAEPSCVSNFVNVKDVIKDDLVVKYVEMTGLKAEITLLKTNTESILNGGIKPSIMEALIDEDRTSQEVRDLLINESPYLDDEVLMAAINKEIPLTQWHLTEILVWNSRLSGQVLEALYQAQPLTNFQYNLVLNADHGSQRLLLEMDIHQKELKLNDLKSEYLIQAWACEDATVNIYDEMINVYYDDNSNYGVSQCIEADLKNKAYTSATSRLNTFMVNNYNSDYNDFYILKINLTQNNKNWMQLSKAESSDLERLSTSTNTFIASKALSILSLVNETPIQFSNLPINLSQPQAKKAYTGTVSDELLEDIMEVSYYSDTKNLVFVNTTNSVTYQIVNSLGKVIEEGKLDSHVETKDVSYLASGVYHIRLISLETKDRCHDKFIVK